jgi:hypothetical protein
VPPDRLVTDTMVEVARRPDRRACSESRDDSYSLSMDTARELDLLYESGARFSISIGERGGFLVKLGNYARERSPRTEATSFEEAVSWVREHAALQQRP